MKKNSRIRTDYSTPLDTSPRRRPNLHWGLRWAALTVGFVALGVVMAKSQDTAAGSSDTVSEEALDPPARESLPLPDNVESADQTPTVENDPAVADQRSVTVGQGDTLARLLQDEGIGPATIHKITTAGEPGRALTRIHPGDDIKLGFDEKDRLVRLDYQMAPDRRIALERGDSGFEGEIVKEPLERRLEFARGVVRTSLFQAAANAGLEDRMIMELTDIFGWDIDFVLDIRRGDRFTVVHESYYKDGDRVRTGKIVAAEFENRGTTHRAIRYTDADGESDYFAPDGTSMRKAFLRSPVEFSRISSRFGKRRHPILDEMRDHQGVDYAAPPGTPIRATGDGRIAERGPNGGYGNFILIRHGNGYSTAYGHMRAFAKGQRVGSSVEQGEIIGYVGSTGRSTGPHLHYEFRVKGEHRDPLNVEFPSSDPIASDERERFEETTGPLVAQLDTLGRVYAGLED
ncbi:MAG: peptidoglycan DD-metalloendopeptidase family protein [Halofilum sp. (in: g-proteobacteria)]